MTNWLPLSLLCVSSALLWSASLVEGRGRLVDPPARSSMWRFGFKTPINYNDNGLNCGGRVMQWTVNQGKCGVCGDPYDGPRNNERGGKYATAIIARTYTQGQVIPVKVFVTANERGWFEFALCPQSDPMTPATEDCLSKNVLELAGGGTRYSLPANANGDVSIDVKLPDNVVCSRCVFRWKWNAGNTWGMDSKGQSCLGCGLQEQFYGCADITILSRSGSGLFVTPSPAAPVTTRPKLTPSSPPSTAATTITSTTAPTILTTRKLPPIKTTAPTTETTTKTQSQSSTSSSQKTCHGVQGQDDLDQWCQVNCVTLNICPPAFCQCDQ